MCVHAYTYRCVCVCVCVRVCVQRDHTLISPCLNMVPVYLRRLETPVSPGNHDSVCVCQGVVEYK